MKYIINTPPLSIRRMEDDISDYNLMAKWLSTPELLDFYEGRSNAFDLEKVIKKYGPRAKGESNVIPFIIKHEGIAVGYAQYYKVDPEEYAIEELIDPKSYTSPYGMDMFIGETNCWNKGIGTIVVKAILKHLFTIEKADIVFIDPQTPNKRAIRCYEKSGFIPQGIIKNRELHDGEYRDSLIMTISFEEWQKNL